MRYLTLLLFLYICTCHAQDDAGRALDDARRMASQGDYEGALAKHIWFHDHALDIMPSYYGVRLSFALSDWIELGKKYPKALETLKNIRNTKTSKLLSGSMDRELFHDVESINEFLGETNATVELFKRIDAVNPDFALTLYDIAVTALVKEKEFELARKYLGDPSKCLAAARRNFEAGMEWAKTSNHADITIEAFETIFTDDVIRIITILNENGDNKVAKDIQTNALKTLDNDKIRNALQP